VNVLQLFEAYYWRTLVIVFICVFVLDVRKVLEVVEIVFPVLDVGGPQVIAENITKMSKSLNQFYCRISCHC
jgi:hypothetical protein